jgi:phosphatidylglycerophosphatase C
VAAFDFDGTLVSGDSLPRFLTRLLGHRRFARVLAGASLEMLTRYFFSGRDGAKAALLEDALAGYDATNVCLEGEAFGAVLAGKVRPDMASCLDWHDRQGHRRVLVSASLAVYLEPFGRLTGFDEVIATRLEMGADGRLTGRLNGPNVRAGQKAIRLAELLGPGPVEVWAYGNSAGDREMLAMADHPIRVPRRPRMR